MTATPTPGDLSARLLAESQRRESEWAHIPTNNPRSKFVHDERLRELLRETAAALSALPAAGGERTPDGYHYVYVDPFGSGEEVIVHNSGGEWNGQRPRRALPYYYTTPQPSAADDYESWAKQERQREDTATRLGSAAVGAQGDGYDAHEYMEERVAKDLKWFREERASRLATPAAGKGVDDVPEYMRGYNDGREGIYRPVTNRTRQPVAGDGMVLVPKEPTDSMLAAAKRFQCDHDTMSAWMEFCGQDAIGQYKAMLAAAPAATPTDGGEGKS